MDKESEDLPGTEPRFDNHLKSNLIHLHKNIYVNRTDPLYFEKILRYGDPKSSEAHYMLAQQYEKDSNIPKAIQHYQEASVDRLSPFYAKAKDRLRRIQRSHSEKAKPAIKTVPIAAATIPSQPLPMNNPRRPILLFLIAANLILFCFLLFNLDIIRAVISTVIYGKAGMEVVYTTYDVPYIIYLPQDESDSQIERRLYNKAFEMAKQNPEHNIQLYGIVTDDPQLAGKTIRLTSELRKKEAIVIAQYNASIDQSVKIQFQNKTPLPLAIAAANIIRTALQAYINENRAPPSSLIDLAQDYPNNYLSFIPNEASSGSNQVSDHFDGTGGWVYHPKEKLLPAMLYPNSSSEAQALQIPYSPIKLFISKSEHTLLVVNNSTLLFRKPVGIGKENRTPSADFTILARVMSPRGHHPDVFGLAGLALGQYALHGTFDQASISSNQSLGCIRLNNSDILALFPFAPKGSEVHIADDLPAAFKNAALTDVQALLPIQQPFLNETAPSQIFNWLS